MVTQCWGDLYVYKEKEMNKYLILNKDEYKLLKSLFILAVIITFLIMCFLRLVSR